MTCDTCDTEPSLSQDEKLKILNSSAFDGVSDPIGRGAMAKTPSGVNATMSDSTEEGEEDCLALEGNDETKESNANAQPKQKRRKVGNDGAGGSSGDDSSSSEDDIETSRTTNTQNNPRSLTAKEQEQLHFAKSKLSKFAARLFDPNRPRGLIEAPKV